MRLPLAAIPYSGHTPDIIAALQRLSKDHDANIGTCVRGLLVDLGWIVSWRCCELTPEGRRVLAEHGQ